MKKTYTITRELETEVISITPLVDLWYFKWSDRPKSDFKDYFVPSADREKIRKSIDGEFEKKMNKFSISIKIEGRRDGVDGSRIYFFKNEFIEKFVETGGYQDFSIQNYYWKPKAFGEVPDMDEYKLVYWNIGDHFVADAEMKPFPVSLAEDYWSNSWDLGELRKIVDKNDRYSYRDNGHVSGNGYGITIYKKRTPEEYLNDMNDEKRYDRYNSIAKEFGIKEKEWDPDDDYGLYY